MGITSVKAQDYTLTDEDVVVENGIIKSCSYDFTITNIIIPATLDGQKVNGISDGTYSSGVFANKGITSVVLPSSIVTIGKYAFVRNSIQTINVPNGVTKIGSHAFFRNKITSLDLPETVTSIGEYAFSSNRITNLVLPDKIKILERNSFYSNLITKLIIPNSVENIMSQAFAANKLTDVTFGTSVRYIDNRAFYGNTEFTSFILPVVNIIGVKHNGWFIDSDVPVSGITIANDLSSRYIADLEYTLKDSDVVVEDGVLKECSYTVIANNIVIPDKLDGQTVTAIADAKEEKGLFANKNLIKVTLPSEIVRVGSYAFADNKIVNQVIPDNTMYIETKAFAQNRITNLTLGNKVQSIGSESFRHNRLRNVVIPPSTAIILGGAFSDNADLSGITLPRVTIEDHEFRAWYSTVGAYSAGSSFNDFAYDCKASLKYNLSGEDIVVNEGVIESCSYNFVANYITIPDEINGQKIIGITDKISDGVFENKGISGITLPATLTELGNRAFANNNIVRVDIPNTVNRIGLGCFSNNPDLGFIVLPTPEKENFVLRGWRDNNGKMHDANTAVTNLNNSYTAVFEIKKYTISGIVTGANDVALTISGDVTETKTVNSGERYDVIVEHGQSVTISVSKEGHSFNENSYSFTDVSSNISGNNFVATVNKYAISGVVTGTDNVIVSISGDVSDSKTLSNGDTYKFMVNYGQSVKISVHREGYHFDKEKYIFSNVKDDKTGNNFSATINSYVISGKVTGADGIILVITGDVVENKVLNDGDNYNINVTHGQSIKVSAVKKGYHFLTKEYSLSDIRHNKGGCDFNALIDTYTISGKISGADYVTVSMSGDVSESKMLNNGESYSFTVNYNQNVKISAKRKGYDFATPEYLFNEVKEDKTDNDFVAVIKQYTITGKIKGANDVKVIASGDISDSKILNDGEEYSFKVNHGQIILVDVEKKGYSFNKQQYVFYGVDEDKTDNDFVATIKQYTISGNVKGADDVEVLISGDISDKKILNDGDSYSYIVDYGQSIKISAKKEGYDFATQEYTFNEVNIDNADNDFVATVSKYTVSGKVTGADNVNIIISGDISDTKILGNGEHYNITVEYNQSVKISAQKSGYLFDKSDYVLNNIKSDKNNIDFNAKKRVTSISKNSSGINIYPNPTKDYITVRLIGGSEFDLAKVCDINGRVLKVESVHRRSLLTIDMSIYNRGVYFLQVISKRGTVSINKIVKE
jgi:hypothetical protein